MSTCFLSEPQNGDFAVCVLSADVPGIPIIPVMAPCETEWLEPGKTAIEVGFGDTSAVPERAEGGKNWLEVTLVRARSNESYLEVSAGSQAGEYYGDSGGPLFFRMPDGTWRLVGTDSGSPDIVAGSAAPRFSVYANAPYFVAWAEQMTGLDLTPCHDERGWHPGGACAEFPVSESPVDDSWANNCSEQPTARPQPSCPDSGSAGGTGAGGAETSGALGEGGAAFIAVEDGNGSPAQGFQPAGGCSQGVGTIHAWSQVFTLLALIGLRRRREGPQR